MQDQNCTYDPAPFLHQRFYLCLVGGGLISLCGLLANTVLCYLMLAKLSFTTSSLFYLGCLSMLDIVVELSYILIFPISILFDYIESFWLYRQWIRYVIPVETLAQIAITASTYMILTASIERYAITTHWTRSFSVRMRLGAVIFVLLFALLIKGSIYLELDVIKEPNCTGFPSIHLHQTSLATNEFYNTVVMFWGRSIFHVFLPFTLLMLLNFLILSYMRKSLIKRTGTVLKMGALFGKNNSVRRSEFKAATRTLVALVSSYLIANTLNMCLTTWEHIDMTSLRSQPRLYSFSTDLSSILVISATAVRLPIYCLCNRQVSTEMKNFLGRCRRCQFAPLAQQEELELNECDNRNGFPQLQLIKREYVF